MTTNELINFFNNTYGIDKEWPRTYEVDAETYLNVCQSVIEWSIARNLNVLRLEGRIQGYHVGINVGPNKGIYFKNVELILVKKTTDQ